MHVSHEQAALGFRRGGGSVHGESLFEQIVSIENIFAAWQQFTRGKARNADVQAFALSLEDNLFVLQEELTTGKWRPDAYEGFYIKDPKLRHIHKASVRDRVAHQALYQVVESFFEKRFIAHSYSSRAGKGTHAGIAALESFARKASGNWRHPVYALSCDIRRFFDSADHHLLEVLLARVVNDERVLQLMHLIIGSFQVASGKGIPLGNVTSQLLANVYLNELDQFAKRRLHAHFYVRYCDDFVVVSKDRGWLVSLVKPIARFLRQGLMLELHPRKVEIRPFSQGIDFLGYIIRPHHRVFRTRTKRRLFKNFRYARLLLTQGVLESETFDGMLHSYQGMLQHCRSRQIRAKLLELSTPPDIP